MEDQTEVKLEAASPKPPPLITGLCTYEVQLVEPTSLFAFSVGVTKAQAKASALACTFAHGSAALRMCWPDDKTWPVKIRPRAWEPGQAVLAYGAEIWEALRQGTKGRVPYAILRDAVFDAHNYALGAALLESEIQASLDFSEGQEE